MDDFLNISIMESPLPAPLFFIMALLAMLMHGRNGLNSWQHVEYELSHIAALDMESAIAMKVELCWQIMVIFANSSIA
jgi:hypothetical protein